MENDRREGGREREREGGREKGSEGRKERREIIVEEEWEGGKGGERKRRRRRRRGRPGKTLIYQRAVCVEMSFVGVERVRLIN